MGLLRSIVLTPTFSVTRKANTYTTPSKFNGGNVHLFNQGARPLYEFELKLEPLFRSAAENLSFMHARFQGAGSFLYDGGPYASIQTFQIFAEGDGSKRQFFLPNRYIGSVVSGGALGSFANSFQFQSQNQITGTTSTWPTNQYSLNPIPGILTTNNTSATTVASGHDLLAMYSCNYRCVFDPDGIKMDEIYKGIFRVQLNLTEVPFYTGSY